MEIQDRLKQFAKGRIRVPLPLRADAYTISSQFLASAAAVEKSVYNFTNRLSPQDAWPDLAEDSRMVFFGLSDFIREYLTDPVTHDDIDRSIAFMKTAHFDGHGLPFPEELWRDVVNEHGGYLPIQIEALPEGSTFFPFEPVIQVKSLDSGFGELAAHIEAVMVGMVSIATARATMERHWLERLREFVLLDYPDETPFNVNVLAQQLIHDFGMRASSCSEESELLGKAHLLVFPGTDTFSAAYQARQQGAECPTGTSILALAHRIVQGFDTERESFERIRSVSKYDRFFSSGSAPIASYVADCYNYADAVEELVDIHEKDSDRATTVVRPDSGDPLTNIMKVVGEARACGWSKMKNGVLHGKNFRYIEGDSVNPTKMFRIMKHLQRLKIAPTSWGIYGIGGYLRNTPNRDSLSSAYKLAAVSHQDIPKVKLSETKGKMSVPGPTILLRGGPKNQPTVMLEPEYILYDIFNPDRLDGARSAYVKYYSGGEFGEACVEDFKVLQERTLKEFDSFLGWDTRFGMPEATCLERGILNIQDKAYQTHKGR